MSAVSFAGGSVALSSVGGAPAMTYTFPQIVVAAANASSAVTGVAYSLCADYMKNPLSGYLYCGVSGTSVSSSGATVILYTSSPTQATRYEYAFTLTGGTLAFTPSGSGIAQTVYSGFQSASNLPSDADQIAAINGLLPYVLGACAAIWGARYVLDIIERYANRNPEGLE